MCRHQKPYSCPLRPLPDTPPPSSLTERTIMIKLRVHLSQLIPARLKNPLESGVAPRSQRPTQRTTHDADCPAANATGNHPGRRGTRRQWLHPNRNCPAASSRRGSTTVLDVQRQAGREAPRLLAGVDAAELDGEVPRQRRQRATNSARNRKVSGPAAVAAWGLHHHREAASKASVCPPIRSLLAAPSRR
jgi:hypothetical protein